ncbi:P-loop containing nucleoside triphosphate hydrolase protein [Phyllosticta capitalensis]|uniref:DNA helicase n=1 Tax=Phyllosticta capitalensis TaxID=121624 RepID=A0ABR1YKL0_9PEZI
MPLQPTDIPSFAATQLSLLDAELDAERAETALLTSAHPPQTLAHAGLAIVNLTIASQRTGLGGKTVLDLEQDSAVKGASGELPQHGIRVGDIVGLAEQPAGSARKKDKSDKKERGVEGVVLKVSRSSVSVALDKEDVEIPGGRLWLVKLANDVTYKRMSQTMTRLQKFTESEYSPFIRALFGLSSLAPLPSDLPSPDWIDATLNDSQKDAIRFALGARELALIHGPPGTGKTHTLIELILQMLRQGMRLLVCGPSNISVDNIVERLAPHKVPIIRLGHPARLLPSVVNHSLDVLTRTSDAAEIVQDIRKEMDQKQASIRKTRNGRERKAIYAEMKDLRKDFREREKRCVDELVRGSKVVLATLHGAGGFHLKEQQFDAVIIDEASQALEAQCWVPLLSAKKVVLAGDHLQLPPTIKSLNTKSKKKNKGADSNKESSALSLEQTLFDRLLALHGPSIKRMLTTQYRMHETIMAFPSQELYESKLVAAESVKARLLCHLPYEVQETDDTREPLVFWDTQGGDFPERTDDESSLLGDSKSNDMEAALVGLHISKLIEAGVREEDIAVVTPYNGQLAVLSQMVKTRYPGLELGSVDGFQGREKEAVVVSLVRSNADNEVGFLSERRRLNVAMTRPKRHLCVVGDSESVGRGGKFLKRWMEFLQENGDLRYPDVDEVCAFSS